MKMLLSKNTHPTAGPAQPRSRGRSHVSGHARIGAMSLLILTTLGATRLVGQDGDQRQERDQIKEALREVGDSNRRLRTESSEALAALLPPESFELGKLSAASLSDGLIAVGAPVKAPEDGGPDDLQGKQAGPELGALILSGSRLDGPPPALQAGLYHVSATGSVVELRGPDGRLAASVPILSDRPLSPNAELDASDWPLAYLSIVRHLSRAAVR